MLLTKKLGGTDIMKIVEEKNSLWHNLSLNMEEAFHQAQKFQYEIGKNSLRLFKSQFELISALHERFTELEEEWKSSYENFIETTKEKIEEGNFQEIEFSVEDWNDKMVEMIEQMKQLTVQPNEATIQFLEKSQQKMLEMTHSFIEDMKEQQRIMVEGMEQYIEIFNDIVKKFEESMKVSVFDKAE